jgi:LCP family protein required for cell wall assembly
MGISMNISDKKESFLMKDFKSKSILRDSTTVESSPKDSQKPSGKKKKFNLDKKAIIKWVLRLVIVGIVLFGGYYAYRVLSFSNNIGFKIKPSDFLSGSKKDPELKKDSTGLYTNVLLVGIDSRGDRSGLKNTDTLIVASYNHQSGDTVMYSIPRDLYAEIPSEPRGYFQKINAMYASGENKSKGGGFSFLEKAIKNTTGLEIQYHAMIDLNGFKKIIDILGGVTVNVENTFTDYCYPVDGTTTQTYFCGALPGMAQAVTFTAGPQTMNGTVALQYARSRHAPGTEGSDFARGRRQQRVIMAVKDKILSSETLINPQKVLEILDALEKNLTVSDFTTNEIQAAINLAKKQKDNPGKMFSFVLEPKIAGGSILKGGGGLRSNLPGFSTSLYTVQSVDGVYPTYTELTKYVSNVQLNPQLYREDPTIRVYDTGITYAKAQAKTIELQNKYPYIDIRFMGTRFTDKEGVVIYSSEQEKYSYSIESLNKSLKTTLFSKPDYITTNLNGENITILLGKEAVVNVNNETN